MPRKFCWTHDFEHDWEKLVDLLTDEDYASELAEGMPHMRRIILESKEERPEGLFIRRRIDIDIPIPRTVLKILGVKDDSVYLENLIHPGGDHFHYKFAAFGGVLDSRISYEPRPDGGFGRVMEGTVSFKLRVGTFIAEKFFLGYGENQFAHEAELTRKYLSGR